MKIVCNACSKKYDPVATAGTCPYCGMHATDEQVAEAQQNDVIKGGSVKEMLRSYLNEKLRNDKKQSPLRKKGVQLALCTALVAIMVGVCFWGNNHYKERVKYYKEQRDTSQITVKQVSEGDSIILAQDVVRLTKCRVMTELSDKVSEGFKLIEVMYEDDGKSDFDILTRPYVITESGSTARCLDLYTLRDAFGRSESELKEDGYREYIASTKNSQRGSYKLVFAVPEAETEHRICLFSYNDYLATNKTVSVRYEYLMKEGE